MKIVICDDDEQEILQISQLVNEFLSSGVVEEQTEVLTFGSSKELI